MGYRNYSTAKGHIVATDGSGDFTTIAAALTAASSGQTVFVKDGTYAENITIPGGVNLVCYNTRIAQFTVNLNGTITKTAAGNSDVVGFNITATGGTGVQITGANALTLNFYDCAMNNSSGNPIFSINNANATVNCDNCVINASDGSTAIFSVTTCTNLAFYYCQQNFTTSSASTIAAGGLTFQYCLWQCLVTTSGTSVLTSNYTTFNLANNTFTCGGSGSHIFLHCVLNGGSASAVTITNTTDLNNCTISSSNTNAIAGSGTGNIRNATFTIGTQIASTLTVGTGAGFYPGNGPSYTLIQTASPSSGTTADFTNGNITNYNELLLTWTGVNTAAGVIISLKVSTDGLSTFVNGDSICNASGGATSTLASAITPINTVAYTSAASGYIIIYNPTGSVPLRQFSGFSTDSTAAHAASLNGFFESSARLNSLRIQLPSSHFTSSSYSLYGR